MRVPLLLLATAAPLFAACTRQRASPPPIARPDASRSPPPPRCLAEPPGGRTLGTTSGIPSLSAHASDALVVTNGLWVSPLLDEPGPRGRAFAFRSLLTGDAAAPLEALDATADVWAAPVALADGLATLTLRSAGPARSLYALTAAGGRTLRTLPVDAALGFLVASAREDVALGVSLEAAGAGGALWLRTVALSERAAATHRVARTTLPPAELAAPGALAVALNDAGGAVVFRAADTLRAVRIDRSGAALGEPQTVATGALGAVTAAYRGEALVVVWAQRDGATAAAPSSLRWSAWDPSREAPPRPERVATGGSASLPSLAAYNGRVALAWTEGDAGAERVRLGVSDELGRWGDAPVTLSDAGASAQAPAVAMTAEAVRVVWAEQRVGGSSLHAATVRCAPRLTSRGRSGGSGVAER